MSRNPLFDLQHPWFIPLWRRVAVTGLCLFWTVVEIYLGDPFWLILFGALTIYCGYSFFFAFQPRPPKDPKP